MSNISEEKNIKSNDLLKKKYSLNDIKESFKTKFHSKNKITKEYIIFLIRTIINLLLSIILLSIFFYIWKSYAPQWQIFFFFTIWSFWMNTFYIIGITLVDILYLVKNVNYSKFNSFLRNYFIRISFPFSISNIIVYWILVLLGDKFQGLNEDLVDLGISFFMQGLVCIFLLFDFFTFPHVNVKKNKLWDLLIITILMAVYFILISVGRYILYFEPYDYIMLCDIRQLAGSFIIIYIIVLNGYLAFYLIAEKFFINETILEIMEKQDNYKLEFKNNVNEKALEIKNGNMVESNGINIKKTDKINDNVKCHEKVDSVYISNISNKN